MKVDEVSIDLLKGMQHQADYKAVNPAGGGAVADPRRGRPAALPVDGDHGVPRGDEAAAGDPAAATRAAARVRGLALIAAADGHPLVTPRISGYLEKTLQAGRADEKQVACATGRWRP